MTAQSVDSKKIYIGEKIFNIQAAIWNLQKEIMQSKDKLYKDQDAMTKEDKKRGRMHIAELKEKENALRKQMKQAILEKNQDKAIPEQPVAKKVETADDPNRTESDSDHEQH